MSEKNARRKRLEKQAKGAQPPPQGEQPAQPQGATTVADLLQMLGAKDVEILGLQRQVAGLQRQVQMLAEQSSKKEKKGKESK